MFHRRPFYAKLDRDRDKSIFRHDVFVFENMTADHRLNAKLKGNKRARFNVLTNTVGCRQYQ